MHAVDAQPLYFSHKIGSGLASRDIEARCNRNGMITMTGQRRREEQTGGAIPSCHNELPLSKWVQCQANGITMTLSKTLGLLLTGGPIKDPSPGGPLVACHKTAPLPIHLGGSPTGCKPPEEEAQKPTEYLQIRKYKCKQENAIMQKTRRSFAP